MVMVGVSGAASSEQTENDKLIGISMHLAKGTFHWSASSTQKRGMQS